MPADAELRVLHVVRQFAPSVGGLEDAVRNLVRQQRSTPGLSPRVLTLDRGFTRPDERLSAREMIDGVPVERIGWRGSSRYPLAPSVLGRLGDADIVHVHAIDFFFDALAASWPVHRKRLVASTHGGIFHTARQLGLKKVWFNTVTRASAAAYDAIVACSASDAAMFAPLARSKLVTIDNGVDVAKFAGAASPEPTRRIICFGRMASHKRIPLLFDLLAILRRDAPDWSLTVAGAPADVKLGELEGAARAAGVGEAVRFVSEPDEAALRAEIGQASYFASASAHEGFGIAAVEALSAGLLPVLSNIPPFAALVRRAGLGTLFEPAELEDAARRLGAIEQSGGATPTRRAHAARVAADYAWPHVAAAYHRVYRQVSAPIRADARLAEAVNS